MAVTLDFDTFEPIESPKVKFTNNRIAEQYALLSPELRQIVESAPSLPTISSGYRDPVHNAEVGGVPNSAHTRGQAFDSLVDENTPARQKYYQSRGLKSFVHDAGSGPHLHTESTSKPTPVKLDFSSFQPIGSKSENISVPENDIRDNSLLGAAAGMAKQLPIPEKLAGGLVRAQWVDPVMNAVKYFQTGEATPPDFIKSFKRGAQITPDALNDIAQRNPVASTVGGIGAAIPEYALGAGALGMGSKAGLLNNLVKGAALNTSIGQGARGLEIDPTASAIDAVLGVGGELLNAAALKSLRKIPGKLMNSALSTPTRVIEKGSTLGQDLVDRGVWGTKSSLRKQAASKLASLEDELQTALASKQDVPINDQKVIEALEQLKASKGNVYGGESDVTHVQDLIEEIKRHPSFGNLNAPEANQMKRSIYRKIGDSGYLREKPSARVEADKTIAGALKKGVEEVVPEVQGINRELGIYSQMGKYAEKQAAKDAIKSLYSPARLLSSGLAGALAGPKGIVASELGRTTIGKTATAQLLNQALKNEILKYLGTIGATGLNSADGF